MIYYEIVIMSDIIQIVAWDNYDGFSTPQLHISAKICFTILNII